MSDNSREPINDELYKEVASEMDLSAKLVKDIVVTQSKLTAQVMAGGTFDSVRWSYLGVFRAKKKIVAILSYTKGLTPEQRSFFKRLRLAQGAKKYRKLKEESIKKKKR